MKNFVKIGIRIGSMFLFALLLMAAAVSPAAAQLQGGNVYPINGTQNPPTSFGTIADAVAYLISNGVTGSGQVILELSTGYPGDTAPITIPAITGVSATLGITFRPAAGYTALTSIPGTSAASSFAIAVTGSYVTLDGQAGGAGGTRDWTIRCTGSGTGGFGRTAFRFGQSSPTANQTDVKVRYCILEGEAANTTSAIVGLEGGASFTDKNFVVENNLIRSTGVSGTTARGYGITIANATNVGNTGLIVRNNLINDFFARGINFTGGFPAALVYGNDIYHTAAVTMGSTTEFSAIYYSTTVSGGTQVYANFIHDIQLTNGSTAVNGIYLFNGSTSGNRVKVYDNRIDIGAGIQPTTFGIWGIRDNSGTNYLFDVDYNSVYIGGSPAAGTANSACYRRELSSATNLRNNVLFNARSNAGTATGTHWAVSINATTNFTSINYNDYFASGTGGVLGTTDGTTTGNRTTLGAWKAVVTADAASVSQNPNFINPIGTPPNLHVDDTIATQLESGGTIVSGIDSDFEGDVRFGSLGYGGTGSAPDIGADEFNGTPLDLTPPSITYTLLGNTVSTTTRAFTNVTVTDASGVNGTLGTRPRVYYKKTTNANAWNDNTNGTDGWKYAEANGNGSPFDFTIDCALIFGGVAPGDVIQYFVVAQDNAPTPNVGINSGTFAAQPASVALTAAAFPINGTINSYSIVSSISGTFTVGTGGNYGTLKAAFDDINAKVVNGNITLTILASGTTETAAAVLNTVSYDGGVYTITVKPDFAASPTITGNITAALIKLAGADNVIFDGSNTIGGTTRDLTISNTSTSASTAAIWLASQGPGAGCTFDTIENCNVACGVDPGASTNETTGILITGNTLSTSTGGEDNNSNTISNNAITKARWGIYARGLTTNLNDNNVFTGNLIGPAALDANRIGAGGLILVFQNLAAADSNEIRNVGVVFADLAGGGDRVGIGLGSSSWTVSATALTNCTVTRNRIYDIFEEKTFSAVGIVVAGIGSPSNNVVANNMIYGIRANGTSPDQTIGIGIGDGNSDKVVYNSIRLSGDIDPPSNTTATQSACGIRIASATPTNLTLKNNVIYDDLTSNTATLHHFAIVAPSTSYAWGTGGCDNNDYYPNPADSQAILGGIGTTVPYADVATLGGWRTQFTPNQDAASVSADPPFVATNDLHILPNVATPLESGGTPIAGVTIDYDGNARNGTTPDIGADEGTFTPLFTNDVAATALVDPPNGGAKTINVAFAPQAAFQNVGTANQTNVKVRYRISGPAPATTIVYADSTNVDLAALGAPTTVTFANATLTTGGVYTMEARSFLAGDQNTPNDMLTGTFEVLGALAGTYPIGAGQPAPFHSLTSAIARLNQVGVSASVVFELVDALYTTPAETFPITINAFAGAGPTSTFTIKPAAAGCAITGSSTSAVIILNGVDYAIVDGSSNGTGSRDLTITNTSTSTSSAVVWGQTSAGPSDGAAFNTVKNLNLVGSGNTQTLVALGFGSTTIGVTSNGTNNNSNTIANNGITKSQYGIYTGGASAAAKNTGNVIAGNEINSVSPNNVTVGGILARFEDGIQITGNKVGEVNRASGTNFGISLGMQAATNLMNVTTGDEVTNAVVAGNKVASIVSPSTTGYSAVGIAVAPASSGTNLIENNMVSGVTSPATPSDFTVGVYSLCGAGSTTRIYFNSVSMTGDRGTGASTPSLALAIAGTDPIVDIRNNILLNGQTTTSTGKSYAIGLSYATYVNLTSDSNDLYVSGPQGVLGIVGGFTSGAAQATLEAWRTTTGKDTNSISADPLFLATNDLHINNLGAATSPVANAGTPIAGVTADFDGETGNRATTPDIGADEFVTYPLTTSVVGNGVIARNPDYATYNPGASVQLTATAGPGYVFGNWSGDLTGNTNPSSLTMDAPKTVTAHFTAVTLAISDVSVLEGNTGTTQARFVVTLSHALPDTVQVQYATADSTATVAGNDYVAASGLLTIHPGVVSDTLIVLVDGDTTNEPDEFYYLHLSNATNALLSDGTGVGTIQNDDAPVDGIEDAAGIPEVTYMGLGFPNPFQERLTVRFGLHASGSVDVRIFDVQGRLVRELVHDTIQAGHKHVVWDGRDNGGRHVATGMYFVRMRTPDRTFKQTIRLLR